jgi:hypothetical protein
MAYLKPPFFVRRVFNPLAMRFGIGGTKTLTVSRRRSGGTQKVPVIPVEHHGARYVVSTRGETEWVRNLRASGTAEFAGQSVRATELAPAERAPVIAAYRPVAGKTVDAYWKKLPDDSDHPVFRLDPA